MEYTTDIIEECMADSRRLAKKYATKTPRQEVVALMRAKAAKSDCRIQELWHRLYEQYAKEYGNGLLRQKKKLDYVEANGSIYGLLRVAQSL